jgi:hypothetical protein
VSIKSKVLAVAGVLTLAGGLSGIGTVAASAATPRCGSGCVEVVQREVRHRDEPGLGGDRVPRDPLRRELRGPLPAAVRRVLQI